MHIKDVCCADGNCGGVYPGAETRCTTRCAAPFETFWTDCGKTIKAMGMAGSMEGFFTTCMETLYPPGSCGDVCDASTCKMFDASASAAFNYIGSSHMLTASLPCSQLQASRGKHGLLPGRCLQGVCVRNTVACYKLRLAFLSECCCDYCVAGWLDSAGRLLDGVCADICSFRRRVCQVLDLSPYHNRLIYL